MEIKSPFKFTFLAIIIVSVAACSKKDQPVQLIKNPVVEGYFADPTIIKHEGKYYIYATKDPWGGNDLAVWVTNDFITWEMDSINWPTKEACTSSTSKGSMVWAPDIIQAKNGKFYIYPSVGSEVWVGVADHPLGPWKNVKPDGTPLGQAATFSDWDFL